MTVDEPAMWRLIPAHKRERVLIAAKAMCRSRDADETEEACTCDNAHCIAFGLYGQMAIEVIEALDRDS